MGKMVEEEKQEKTPEANKFHIIPEHSMEISNSNKNSNTLEDSQNFKEAVLKVEPLTAKMTQINTTKSNNTATIMSTLDDQTRDGRIYFAPDTMPNIYGGPVKTETSHEKQPNGTNATSNTKVQPGFYQQFLNAPSSSIISTNKNSQKSVFIDFKRVDTGSRD